MNSAGVVLGGGVGWLTAEWIKRGRAPGDFWNSDVRRFMPFQNNSRALADRIPEVLSEHLTIPWPNRDYVSVRGVRRSPLHQILKEKGAHFTQRGSWERPLFFDSDGKIRSLDRTYQFPNWFQNWKVEHNSARTNVAIFDQSAFAKLIIQGRDVEHFLQRVCANDMAVPVGKVVYTTLLNEDGGIESDLTITRLEPTVYFAVTGSQQGIRDAHWLRRNVSSGEAVTVTDVTSAYAVIAITGPKSREFLSTFTNADLGNGEFPFGTARWIDAGYATALTLRLSYAGELGWEFYVPSDLAADSFERLLGRPNDNSFMLAGAAALASLRLEKGFRSWGHDIGPADNPLEAGLMSVVRMKKPLGFIGRTALVKAQEAPVTRRLISVVIESEAAFPHGNEPIFVNGELCGALTSASFGHSVGRGVGLAWIKNGALVKAAQKPISFEIEIEDRRYPISIDLKAPYDPQGRRMRA
jgi:4-methylaminobutanoate oxidase (formaldehyde-forming)